MHRPHEPGMHANMNPSEPYSKVFESNQANPTASKLERAVSASRRTPLLDPEEPGVHTTEAWSRRSGNIPTPRRLGARRRGEF